MPEDYRSKLARRATGREIGPLECIADMTRRQSCRRSPLKFGQTYFSEHVYRQPSPDHREVWEEAKRAILKRGRYAFAMPRGYGKSSIMRICILWAVLYGLVKYVLIITSEIGLGTDFLGMIADELQDNELLRADFPELKCFYALDGEPRKQGGQTVNGKKTKLLLSTECVQFPSFRDDERILSSEAIIEVKSITSRIRGRSKRINGVPTRPQLCVLDDVQSDEMANSPEQVAKYLRVINKTIAGLGEKGGRMAIFFIGTVITSGDLCDILLDHKKSPRWRGKKSKLLYAFPNRLDLWEGEYADLLNASLLQYGDHRLANNFYKAHREEMSEGAKIGWKACYEKGEDVDALQYAMNLYLDDKEAFYSEQQNEPYVDESTTQKIRFHPGNLSGYDRYVLPSWASGLYVGVDVQKALAYYVVLACAKDFRTAVVDWGTWPQQRKKDFWYDAQKVRSWLDPHKTEEASIKTGLRSLLEHLQAISWHRVDGEAASITGGLVDAGYKGYDAVIPLLNESAFQGKFFPVFGRSPGVLREQFCERRPREDEIVGHNLLLCEGVANTNWGILSHQYIALYTNEWKTQLSQMCLLPAEKAGSLVLWGEEMDRHSMYLRHLASEYPETVTGRVRMDIWHPIPHTENHLLDATIYALGAASIGGCVWNRELAPVGSNRNHDELEIDIL